MGHCEISEQAVRVNIGHRHCAGQEQCKCRVANAASAAVATFVSSAMLDMVESKCQLLLTASGVSQQSCDPQEEVGIDPPLHFIHSPLVLKVAVQEVQSQAYHGEEHEPVHWRSQ